MQWNQVDECATLTRERSQCPRLFHAVVHAAKHHVFKRHAAVEHLCRLDDFSERKLGVDRHELLAELVRWRVNGDREPELLRTLSKRDDAWQHTNRVDGDVARTNAERARIIEQRE